MKNYLNFESEIKNLEVELDKLKDPYNSEGLSEVDTQNISKLQNLKKQVILQQATNTYPNKLKNFSKRPFSLFFKSILLAEASLSLLTKFNPDKQISI